MFAERRKMGRKTFAAKTAEAESQFYESVLAVICGKKIPFF
jgi:hypothetical protein